MYTVTPGADPEIATGGDERRPLSLSFFHPLLLPFPPLSLCRSVASSFHKSGLASRAQGGYRLKPIAVLPVLPTVSKPTVRCVRYSLEQIVALFQFIWLGSPMFWVPRHQSTSSTYTPSRLFQFHLPPSPPHDNIRVMMIVWRLRGNIIRTALCWIV